MSKPKYSVEEKLEIIKAFKGGMGAYSQLKEIYGVHPSTVHRWVARYEVHGIRAFVKETGVSHYSQELKLQCVKEYLNGEGSLSDIVLKYNISDEQVLRAWIKRYNANMEFKGYESNREVYMASARRKTTLEERKEIVEYCLAHEKDYKGTAIRYSVSYDQVYSWVQKYLTKGEDGLTDKRGRHKADDEVDELERLRRENARLKCQLEERDMVVELLKKVNDFEGM